MAHLQNFNYQLYGQEAKPKLVFLHGLMGYGLNWRSLIRALEQDYHILSYDQRGHGKSFQPDEGYAPSDYAEDLHKILSDLNWQKVILVGHSMGGRNAMHFAAQYPEQLEALVIEDIGPEASKDSIHRLEAIITSVAVPYATKAEAKKDLERKFDKTLSNFILSNLEETDGQILWRPSKRALLASLYAGREKNHWEEWKKIRQPILVIRGERSNDLSAEVFQKMLATNKNARGVTIANAGHWVHFEQAEDVLKALKDFFQSLSNG